MAEPRAERAASSGGGKGSIQCYEFTNYVHGWEE